MGVLTYKEVAALNPSGLGYAEIVVGLIQGLATAGSSAYQTYEMSKATKGSQKLNQTALQMEAELRQRELEAQKEAQRQQNVSSQAKAILYNQTFQVGLAGVALVGVTYLMFFRKGG